MGSVRHVSPAPQKKGCPFLWCAGRGACSRALTPTQAGAIPAPLAPLDGNTFKSEETLFFNSSLKYLCSCWQWDEGSTNCVSPLPLLVAVFTSVGWLTLGSQRLFVRTRQTM